MLKPLEERKLILRRVKLVAALRRAIDAKDVRLEEEHRFDEIVWSRNRKTGGRP